MKSYTRLIWAVWLFFMGWTSTYAQQVHITLDHDDWNYSIGQKAVFTITVSGTQSGTSIDYEIGPEMYPKETVKGLVLSDSVLTLSSSMKKPGFLRLKVVAHVHGKDVEAMATAAFDKDKIGPYSRKPRDFDSFWQKTIADSKCKLEPKLRLIEDQCTELDNVYEVSYWVEHGGRFYGMLTVPKAEGRYPALLKLPGAGIRSYRGDTSTLPGQAIILEVGIHGVPVTMEDEVYRNLEYGPLSYYYRMGLWDKDQSYYKRVVAGVLRSIDYLCSLPQFDGVTLGVSGGSQGGALSIIAASLDSRVCFACVGFPALADHEASLHGRACGWPHYFYGEKHPHKRYVEAARYYDVVNFAHGVKVPVWCCMGYNDDVVAPSSIMASFNVMTCPKELDIYKETGHWCSPEEWQAWLSWVRKQLLKQ